MLFGGDKLIEKERQGDNAMYDIGEYYQYLISGKVEEAINYKNNGIPQFIYKYYSFGSAKEKLYYDKLVTLIENKIFFSSIEKFNDPFEFKTAYINIDENKDNPGYIAAEWRDLFNRSAIRIASFAENGLDIPMWAYYSDSFKGYCVKYEVLNKDKFFSVHYLDERLPSYMINSILQKDDDITFLKAASLYCTKYMGWEHEKEIRAVIKRDDYMRGPIDAPCSVSCEELGIKPAELVLGCKCDEIDKQNMNAIIYTLNSRKGLSIEIKQMEIQRKGFGFDLKELPITIPTEDDVKRIKK